MKILRFTFAAEIVFFLSLLSFRARLSAGTGFFLMISVLVLLVVLPVVFVSLFVPRHKSNRLKGVGVLLFVPVSVFPAALIGDHVSDYLFYRDLPRFNKVVALIQRGSIPYSNRPISLPAQFRNLSNAAFAHRDPDGVLNVEFIIGSTFPLKHEAYVFRSDGVLSGEIQREWPSGFRRDKHWFEVRD